MTRMNGNLRRSTELRFMAAKMIHVAAELECIDQESVLPEKPGRRRPSRNHWSELNKTLYLQRAIELYKNRRIRGKFFRTDIFGEPAWDMMLDLFINRMQNKQISVSSACLASNVPATTGLRWLKQLESCGLIERVGKTDDQRVVWVKLSDDAMEGMFAYFEECFRRANEVDAFIDVLR